MYTPGAVLIELHAIEEYLAELSAGSEALDLETVAQMVAMACGAAVGSCEVRAVYKLRNLEMICHINL